MVAELVFVAKFWWKVLGGFARERDKEVERKERWKRRERNKFFSNIFDCVGYIILLSCV